MKMKMNSKGKHHNKNIIDKKFNVDNFQDTKESHNFKQKLIDELA